MNGPPLPFEFVVVGRPVSHQTNNRPRLAAWQATVRAVAAVAWGQRPRVAGPLRLTVAFYHDGPQVRMDGDNLLKPVQDALNGLVYDDDVQMTDTLVRKTPIRGPICVPGQPVLLLLALQAAAEFIHVTVDFAPDHSTPLR